MGKGGKEHSKQVAYTLVVEYAEQWSIEIDFFPIHFEGTCKV